MTVAIAVPILLGAAAVEIWVSPRLLESHLLLTTAGRPEGRPAGRTKRLGRCQHFLSLVTGDFCPVSDTNVT